MGKKKYTDEGASLFDTPTPLVLPVYDPTQLTSKTDFLADTKHTLGMVAKITKQVTNKVAEGESPNHYISKFLIEISQVIKQSITSYNELNKMETDTAGSDAKVYIEFK